MFKTVPGCRASIESGLFVQLGRFRHDVFVKRLKWDLPMVMAADECEWDEFDRADTVYVVLRTREGEVQGCARLLPTTGPYLMRKLVPDAEADLCDPHVWELSRVAVTQGDAAVPADRKDRMKALLAAVIDAARGRGIRRLIGIAAPAMMRLYQKKGFELLPQGPTFTLEGELLVRFSLYVSDTRTETRIDAAAIQFSACCGG